MSADVKECRRAVATTEELAGQPLSDQAGVNLGQLAAEERQCMQARGYCSMSTYDAGYWANDGKGNYTWHRPVKGAGRQCLEATTREHAGPGKLLAARPPVLIQESSRPRASESSSGALRALSNACAPRCGGSSATSPRAGVYYLCTKAVEWT